MRRSRANPTFGFALPLGTPLLFLLPQDSPNSRFGLVLGPPQVGRRRVGCARAFDGGSRPPAGNWPLPKRFTHTKA